MILRVDFQPSLFFQKPDPFFLVSAGFLERFGSNWKEWNWKVALEPHDKGKAQMPIWSLLLTFTKMVGHYPKNGWSWTHF